MPDRPAPDRLPLRVRYRLPRGVYVDTGGHLASVPTYADLLRQREAADLAARHAAEVEAVARIPAPVRAAVRRARRARRARRGRA